MSLSLLFRCNMDEVLQMIFLGLDPASLHRARQVHRPLTFSIHYH